MANKRKRQQVVYWGPTQEQAVIDYNNTTDQKERNKIFNECLYRPFYYMAEAIFQRYKFKAIGTDYDQMYQDAVAYISTKLDRYDPNQKSRKYKDQPTKAFGYFSLVTKNYYILQSNNGIKADNRLVPLVHVDNSGEEVNIIDNHQPTYTYNAYNQSEFYTLLHQWWTTNISKVFKKPSQQQIATTFLELTTNPNTDIYYKKAIFRYVKNKVQLPVPIIGRVLKQIHSKSAALRKEYIDTGTLDM